MARINLPLLFITLLLFSCSTTRNLPKDEVLYTGIKKFQVANYDHTSHGDEAVIELEAALAYPPNNALMGSAYYRTPFPFRLWWYNSLVNHNGKVGKWIFNHFAANPIYISTANPELRAKIATNVLHNYGYFQATVSHEVVPQRNPRKAKVNYYVDMKRPYLLDSIAYERFMPQQDSLIGAADGERLLRKGSHFSVMALDGERQRVANVLRNNGYYYYRYDLVTFLADTVQTPYEVDIKVVPIGELSPEINRPWRLGDLSLYLRRNGETKRSPLSNSVGRDDLHIYFSGEKIPIRPQLLFHCFRFRHGELYSAQRQQLTQQLLNRMGVFSFVEFTYTPRDTTATCDVLDVALHATLDKPLEGTFEFDIKSKSNDQMGPGVSFSVAKHNAFRGGETFSVKLNASYEWQVGSSVQGGSSVVNSYEYGLTSTLDYPYWVLPFAPHHFTRATTTSQFKVSVDQLSRAGYFKLLSLGGNISYTYQRRADRKHSFAPFKLTYNLLQHTTAKFDSITATNAALYASLRDQFIPAMTYSYTYDNSMRKSPGNSFWWESSVTSAGNITSLLYAACGEPLGKQDKPLMGNPFAQFLKLTTELRKSFVVGEKSHIATRFMCGAIWAYGNSTTAPYSEQFFIGGANSIRAFTIRSIGPGMYRSNSTKTYAYLDQTGDCKVEANVEYRFPLIENLYGAAFLDMGNIWLLHDDEQREGAKLSWARLGKDIAVVTGVGLRYDLEFLILRFDMGVGIHAPYETTRSGYYNMPKFGDSLTFHFAIGYPF